VEKLLAVKSPKENPLAKFLTTKRSQRRENEWIMMKSHPTQNQQKNRLQKEGERMETWPLVKTKRLVNLFGKSELIVGDLA
jgi:hypothetical protein